MEILKCEGIKKVYGSGANQVKALDGIDLVVNKGEFVAIIGASGSGKSTLLHILGNVDKPTEGKVVVGETDICFEQDAGCAIPASEGRANLSVLQFDSYSYRPQKYTYASSFG